MKETTCWFEAMRITLSRIELANAMGVSPNSIDKLEKAGAIPPPTSHPSLAREFYILEDVVGAIRAWRATDASGTEIDEPSLDL